MRGNGCRFVVFETVVPNASTLAGVRVSLGREERAREKVKESASYMRGFLELPRPQMFGKW